MAFCLVLIYLGVTLGFRTWWQYRGTGDCGVRVQTESWLHFSASTGMGLFFSLLFVLSLWQLVRPFSNPSLWAQTFGLLFCLLGTATSALAQHQMGQHWRIGIDIPSKLVKEGLFQRTRNPIYLGALCFSLGQVLLMPTFPTALTVTFGCLMVMLQVCCVEEPHLRKSFGEEFETYCRETPRYF